MIGTLPDGYRPSGNSSGASYGAIGLVYSGGLTSFVRVKTNGQVVLDKGSTSAQMTGQVVFPA